MFCCSFIMSTVVSRGKRGQYGKTYKKADLVLALSDYRSACRTGRKMTFERAGAPYNIPPSTLRRVHRKTEVAIASAPRHSIPDEVAATAVTTSRTGKHKRLLTDEYEHKLCEYINLCKDMTHPVDVDVVKLKAKRLSFAANNVPITEENKEEAASPRWWQAFRKRHPTLTLRTPQQLALQRAKATQPEIINHFYDLLKLALDTYKFQPHQIWAMDETGVDNNFKVRKVVANKGMYMHARWHVQQMCGCIVICFHALHFHIFCTGDGRVPLLSSKLTSHMSILHVCNANGVSLPPMYVFSGKNLVNHMLEGAPEGQHNTPHVCKKVLINSVIS
jgi:hypothetical protein